MKTIITVLAVLTLSSAVAAQDKKDSKGPSIECTAVGGGVEECIVRDSQGKITKCTNVGGVCIAHD